MVSVTGILNSLRKARKRSISETLEELDINIGTLEDHKRQFISSASKVGFHLIFYASVIYASGLIFAYFLIRPSELFSKVAFIGLAIAYPLVVWLLRYVINFYYLGSADRADKKLKDLKKQKKTMLLKVMDTETYNKAQQILKRFDPLCQFQNEPSFTDFMRQNKGNVVRNRYFPAEVEGQANKTPYQRTENLLLPVKENLSAIQKPANLGPPPTPVVIATKLPPPIRHRPILPRERSIFDKLIDAVVGDGPDRRYALICQRCAAHNGMSLAEEFEFIAFRCCYCEFLNPARRVRRNSLVPRLDTFPSPGTESQCTPLSLKDRRVYSSSVVNLSMARVQSSTSEEAPRNLHPLTENSPSVSKEVIEDKNPTPLASSVTTKGDNEEDDPSSSSSSSDEIFFRN